MISVCGVILHLVLIDHSNVMQKLMKANNYLLIYSNE